MTEDLQQIMGPQRPALSCFPLAEMRSLITGQSNRTDEPQRATSKTYNNISFICDSDRELTNSNTN